MKLAQTYSWDAPNYGKFSNLILDYLTQNEKVSSFYSEFPKEKAFKSQAERKLKTYHHRELVHSVLAKQLKGIELSPKQTENLEKFKLKNSLSITTGHQLNLFTGPLYFFYKIIQVIKASEQMSAQYPEYNFVPIFWMATEDHDFEEINHFYYQDKKITWNKNARGAVGRLDLEGLNEVFSEFFSQIPDSKQKKELEKCIENAYLNSKNLAEASLKLVHSFFGEYGLLILDGDDKELKSLMIPAFEKDLTQHSAYKVVNETNQYLENKGYHLQVHPREINLFYLENDRIRERIVYSNERFQVLNTNYEFSKEELLEELHHFPEKFSPNVILRPLYQETILPNIAYVGGSGEIAYWLQLKDFFESQEIPFPLLIVRNSLLLISEKQRKKLEKLNIKYEDLNLSFSELLNQNIKKNSSIDIPFEKYESQLYSVFDDLEEKAIQTDVSFSKMVLAQRKKQLNGLEKMKKRLIKAEKRKQSERVKQIEELYNTLFPNKILQERILNFSVFYLEYGKEFIAEIYKEVEPIDFRFTIKTLV